MAFNPAPSAWMGSGFTVDTTAHTIELTTDTASSNQLLLQLTDALSDPTTGDVRSVFFALCEMMFQARLAQGANQPVRMSVIRLATNGPGATINLAYTLSFQVNPTGETVAPE